jgi:hypothetical protein
MTTKWRGWAVAGILLAFGICFFSGGDSAAQKKNNQVWQPILPKEEYDELVARVLSGLQKDIADINMIDGKKLKQRLKKLRATGILIATLVQSNGGIAKDPSLATLRDAALDLNAAAKAANVAAVVKAANALPPPKANPKAKLAAVPLRGTVADKEDMMTPMKVKGKGGDGLDPDLQSNFRLKGALNGVEEKIRELAKKKLPAAQMKKQAEELSLMAYKVAAIAQCAEDYTPRVRNKGGKKTPQNWARWSGQMRTLALELAKVAKKEDAAKVFAVAGKLNTNCNACHGVFK